MPDLTRPILALALGLSIAGFAVAAEEAGHDRHPHRADAKSAVDPHAQHKDAHASKEDPHAQHTAMPDKPADAHAEHQDSHAQHGDTHAGKEDPHAQHKAMPDKPADAHAEHQDPHAQHGDTHAGKEDPHAEHQAMMNKPAVAAKSADIDLKDLELVDQDGRRMKFVSDVISDKIVVMDFVYTTCTTVCPVLSSVLKEVQARVGDRLEQDVRLVSVTVDAARDTPQRMKAYAAKYDARPGWLWLTGPEPRVDSVLDGIGAYAPNFEDHPAMVLVGDGRTGAWSRFFGFPSPDRIMEQVNTLQAARQGAAGG